MKSNKKINFFKILLPFLICIVVCITIYFLVDNVFNGFFLDWFDKNYMINTENVPFRVPNWNKIKTLLLITFIVISLVDIIIVFIVSHFYSKKKKKILITEISKNLHNYMKGNTDIDTIFPREQSEIAIQLSEIKSNLLNSQQTLIQETNRKNDLIVYLAHDLKTPLTSIIGYLELLKETPDLPIEQRLKYTNITLDKAYRLEDLMNEFFEIAKFNDTQIVLMKKNLNLKFMFEQIIDEFYPLTSEQNKEIIINCDDKIICFADPDKISRAFNNVIKNAIHYSFDNSKILIDVCCESEFISVSIQNEGNTIPENKLDSIFEKFYRLDDSRNTSNGGAGLGLAIAKEIITLHGGNIFAKSNNNITTFTIQIPQNKE